MTTFEFPELSIRPSDAERDRVIDMLKEGAANGRLSHDTFMRRMELALHARGRSELRSLTSDLPVGARPVRPTTQVAAWLARAATASVDFAGRTRRNLRSAGLPKLMLPAPGMGPVRIGRGTACDLRIADDRVSRLHAELRCDGAKWLLRDLGSMNGTWVNGVRVVGEVPVRVGDMLRFGQIGFRLAGR